MEGRRRGEGGEMERKCRDTIDDFLKAKQPASPRLADPRAFACAPSMGGRVAAKGKQP